MTTPQPYETRFASRLQQVRETLTEFLNGKYDFPKSLALQQEETNGAAQLWDAMRYSALNSGKLVRPVLCLEVTKACGGTIESALPTACSIELVHTQSLIHDDLPCMDNDDLRRGKPTLHKQYDESTAVLAGDALLAMAFGLISENTPLDDTVTAERLLRVIGDFSAVSSVQGLVNGQYVDILYERKPFDADVLNYIHTFKTGALFRFSTRAGAILAGADEPVIENLTNFGEKIGLAFQIVDDLLDIQSDAATLGKTVGKDQQQCKATYPALYGEAESKRQAEMLIDEACASLKACALDKVSMANTDALEYLAYFMIERIK